MPFLSSKKKWSLCVLVNKSINWFREGSKFSMWPRDCLSSGAPIVFVSLMRVPTAARLWSSNDGPSQTHAQEVSCLTGASSVSSRPSPSRPARPVCSLLNWNKSKVEHGSQRKLLSFLKEVKTAGLQHILNFKFDTFDWKIVWPFYLGSKTVSSSHF